MNPLDQPAASDDDQLLDWLDTTGKPVQPLGPPGVWHHFGRGLGDSIMGGLARTGRAAAVAGAAPVVAFDKLHGDTRAEDWYFENVVGATSNAVDYWTPDAANVGTAGQALNGLVQTLVPLAAGGGNPVPLLGTVALDTPVDLLDKGASLGSAIGVAGIQTVATAAGFKLPAAWGANLATRLATGAGGNLAIGEASRDLSARALAAGGSHDLAEQYTGTATDALIDLGMGAVFGGLVHATAPGAGDAVLTARNARHFQETAHPGTPADGAAANRAQNALSAAIRKTLNGDRVSVADAIRAEDFTMRPGFHVPDLQGALDTLDDSPGNVGLRDYTDFRHALESGGRADAANPRSTAMGIDQFTAGTWRNVVAAAKPVWAEGLTDTQLLAARTDPAKSAEMVAVLDRENANALRAADVPVDNFTLYAAHHFGPDKAIAFAKAPDDAPATTFLTSGQIKANPYLKGKNKAEIVADWKRRGGMATDPDIGAAMALSDQQPDALIVDGFDGDGAPRYRSATEAMADIDTEHQRAVNDAEAYLAAVDCHLRRGVEHAA